MRLPPFLPRAHGAGEVGRGVGRKLLALALFPFLLCVFTGSVGTCLQKEHATHARLAREGVNVVATVTELQHQRLPRAAGRAARSEYRVSIRYGLDAAQDRRGEVSVAPDEFRRLTLGAPLPVVVLPTDPAVFATSNELIESMEERPSDLWGMAFAFGLCASSVLSLFAGFARMPRRRTSVTRG